MPVGGGGPTWLTGWIKLNNKHAVHVTSKSSKPEEEEEKCQQTATTARSPVTEISSKTASRNWSRKTKEQPIVIEESSETELPYHLSHQVSHQILSEAAFMIASADPELLSAELNPFPCGKPIRMSPEGLIVTTGVEKPQPHFNKAKTGNLNRLTSIFAREREPCQSCISLEQKLSAAYDDLEYMRGVAVHQASCGAQQHHAIEDACDGKCIQSSRTQPSATATNEFGELVKRHKQVVEALISERAQYQETTEKHLKQHEIVFQFLSKEAVVKQQETLAIQRQLDTTRSERDELAIENLRLKAQVSSHAKQQVEYSELKRRYLEYEERGIQGAMAAIESRDKIIDDLATKLERSLNQLELEREQHRQRRQIIFPSSPSVTAKKG